MGEGFTFTAHDLRMEPANFRDDLLVGDGTWDPERIQEIVAQDSERLCRSLWRGYMEMFFKSVIDGSEVPAPLFATKRKDKEDFVAHIVKKTEFGRLDRPVLKRHPMFVDDAKTVGKVICLQYAIDTDKEPREVCNEIPFDFFPTEIWKMREFAADHDALWAIPGGNEDKRIPLSVQQPLQGMLYLMYSLDEGDVIPHYIGISRKMAVAEQGGSDGLNWNFKNFTSDSVFGRWGYGSSQHLGELSRVIFNEQYPDSPSDKYKRWVDKLFVKQTRLLKKPLYIRFLPWFDKGLLKAEHNLIHIASYLYPDELLNHEHSAVGEWHDDQTHIADFGQS